MTDDLDLKKNIWPLFTTIDYEVGLNLNWNF